MLNKSVSVLRHFTFLLRYVAVVAIMIGLAGSALAQQARYEGRLSSEWEADLRDLSPGVRLRAVEALGYFGIAAVPSLARALSDSDPSVAHAGEEQLKRIGPAGIPALAGLQGQPTFARAIKSLWIPFDVPMDSDRFKAAVRAVQTLPSSTALPVLVSCFRHSDREVRDICGIAISVMGPEAKRAVPAIANVCAQDHRCGVLGGIGSREVVPILLKQAKERNPEARMDAVGGLFEMSQGLHEPYTGHYGPITYKFRDTLGPTLALETADSLIPLLSDVNVIGYVPALLIALVPTSIGPMIRAGNSNNAQLRKQVLSVFALMGDKGGTPLIVRDAIAELQKLSQTSDPSVRSVVSSAMQTLQRRP